MGLFTYETHYEEDTRRGRPAYTETRPAIGRIVAAAVLGFAVLSATSCSFTRVGQGHVGVKVNNVGSGAGVSKQSLGVGWYFTPPGVTIYEYPVYTDTYTWQFNPDGANERFTFQDKNGLSVSADVAVSFRADPTKAPLLFQKYRVGMDGIVAGPLRRTIQNALVQQASTLSVEQIYGSNKAALIAAAQKQASAYLEPFGLHIEQLQWTSNIVLPKNIQERINERVANEQEALAAQASVATRRAEADAAIETARGKAEALRIEQAAIQNSPQIVELRAIEAWDGKLPQYVVGGATMPFIGSVTK